MQNSWLNDFETGLDLLERASTGADVDFSDIHNHAIAALKCLGTVHDISIWLARPDGVEELRPDDHSPAPSEVIRAEITAATQEAFVLTDSASATSPAQQLLTVSAPLADDVFCVLRGSFDQLSAPQQTFIEGMRAVVDVIGGWVSRQFCPSSFSEFNRQSGSVGDGSGRPVYSGAMSDRRPCAAGGTVSN
ncbi:MAG: hypothetical protein GY826_33210 [Fuerstiella sp.]|nr:hypothetical protein [Fuerstiella sp.]